MLRKLSVIAFVVLGIAVAGTECVAQSTAAYVKDLNGEWHLDRDASPLTRGKALAAGNRITFRPSNVNHSFITIADVSGRTIIYKNCDRGDCNRPFSIPNPNTSQPSVVSRIFSRVMLLWASSPEKYTSFISRAPNTLDEAVLRLDGDELDLAPAMVKLRRGQYLLRFKSLSAPQDNKSDSISFHWDPSNRKTLKINGLRKGLYELQLLDPVDKGKLEPGTEAWVLIAPSADYERLRKSFLEARTMTSQWEKDTTDEAKRSFLRGYLDSLAAE